MEQSLLGRGTEPPMPISLENPVGGQPFKLWRTTHGTGVVPWGTTSMSHRYRYLISLITFRCPFFRADVLSVIFLFPGPLCHLLVPIPFLRARRRLAVWSSRLFPSILSPPLPTSSHPPHRIVESNYDKNE